MDNLTRIDLNLLVTLEALLTERNVTRAAQRLHLSQPSVSVQLRKLREIFADPLLVNSSRGMLPTTRAEELLQPLRDALAQMRNVLDPHVVFEPARSRMTWQIAAADYAEHAILLPLLPRLQVAAPGINIAVRHVNHALMMKQLESGRLDAGFLALDGLPEHLHHRVLFKERYLLVMRRRHPALKRKLTLDALCQLNYVIVSLDGGGFRGALDQLLESRGRKRRVALSVPHFLFVPQVLARTDLVALLPERLIAKQSDGLRVLAPPLPVPGFDMAMLWHERSHLDPAHAWLRAQVAMHSE